MGLLEAVAISAAYAAGNLALLLLGMDQES
jgi:hypothetical protein